MDDKKLLDKALEWYQHSDLRQAALDLFPEKVLEKELESYRKRKAKEREKTREIELQKMLERCKKLFPIGTLMWNDEGSDQLPNIVIGEPYIGSSPYHYPRYTDYFGPGSDLNRRTVLVKSVRVSDGNVPADDKFYLSKICLENSLYFIDHPSEWTRSPLINLVEYQKQEIKKRDNSVKDIQKDIERLEKSLSDKQERFSYLMMYNPMDFSKERIKEIVKRYT